MSARKDYAIASSQAAKVTRFTGLGVIGGVVMQLLVEQPLGAYVPGGGSA